MKKRKTNIIKENKRNFDILLSRLDFPNKIINGFIVFFSPVTTNMKLGPGSTYKTKESLYEQKLFYKPKEKKEYDGESDKFILEAARLFVSTIKKQNPNFDLTNFYNKFDDVLFIVDIKLKYRNFTQFIKSLFNKGEENNNNYYYIAGAYYDYYNMIGLNPDVVKNGFYNDETYHTLFHELFHAVSSPKPGNGGFRRFKWIRDNFKFKQILSMDGFVLNEGYTELLTIKYFYPEAYGISYPQEVFIMSKLEQIIGSDILEKLYVNGDFAGLYRELLKYLKKDEVEEFVSCKDMEKMCLYLLQMYKEKCVQKNGFYYTDDFIISINNVLQYIKNNDWAKEISQKKLSLQENDRCKEYINILRQDFTYFNDRNNNDNQIYNYNGPRRGFVVMSSILTIIGILVLWLSIFLLISMYLK